MSRLFTSLPSLNDLLETQPLKGVIDRVGRNQVVAETARFLDRLRLQAQTTGAVCVSVHNAGPGAASCALDCLRRTERTTLDHQRHWGFAASRVRRTTAGDRGDRCHGAYRRPPIRPAI